MSRVLERLAAVFVEPVPRDAPRPTPDSARRAILAAPEQPVARTGRPSETPDRSRPAVRWLAPSAAPPASAACAPAVPAAARRSAPAIAVLCPARDVGLAAGSAALALIELADATCAVVAEWRAEHGRRAAAPPPGRASRRRAQSLAGGGYEVQARGRLAAVTLPDAEPAAAADVGRLAAASREPLVVALGGPRGGELDEALCALDLALVVCRNDDDAAVGELAVGELERRGLPALRLTLSASPAAAALARAGIRLPAVLRPPLLEALERLG